MSNYSAMVVPAHAQEIKGGPDVPNPVVMVIVLAALGGLLTPSNDLPSMALMAVPLLLLYFSSIFLVKMVEGWKAKEKAKGH